jgi:epoxide hydrolase 4
MLIHTQVDGADGVRLHAATNGTSGPVMLFLHGFPEFWGAWHRQLDEFSPQFRTVALDLRGYNRSDKPDGAANYVISKLVDDIRAVLRSLSGGQRAIVVGHDWGGIIGWSLACESPELLERLIIINAPHPVLFHRELKQNSAQRIASSYAGFFQLRGVAEAALQAFDYAALRKMVFGTSAKPRMFSSELRRAYRDAWSQPGAITGGLNYYRNVRALRQAVAQPPSWRIEVPTLVLWGERDPAVLLGNLVGLDEFVPQLTVRRHAAATHWVVHEEPEWINESIRAFIAGRPS